jgi:hypothetical protein
MEQLLADDIMTFNWMSWPITVPVPGTVCVASKVAMATSPEYDKVLGGLRTFRDNVLKPRIVGRRLIQSYYSHSPEMAMLLIGNPEARWAGQVIVEHFSQFGAMLKDDGGLERLSGSQEVVLPPRVIGSIRKISKIINDKGSTELKRKLVGVREFLKTFEGLSVSQAVQIVSAVEIAGRGKEASKIRPLKFAPGSPLIGSLLKRICPGRNFPDGSRKGWGL